MDEIKSFVNAADMLDKIRENNMTTIDSVCELIDNSFDAHAKNIWINFGKDKKTGKIWMIVQDDGDGIEKKDIKRALALAGTMNEKYSKKIGRFGMGLSNACASQSSNSILASKRKEDGKIWTNGIDFEYLKQTTTTEFPPTDELKDEFLLSKIKFKDSGTLVCWNPCDNLDKINLAALNKHLLDPISRLYRYFLNAGKKIYMNDTEVKMFDPLCRLENHRYAKEYGFSKIYGEPIVIPVKRFDDEQEEETGKVVVELVMLDYDKINDNENFHPKKGNKLKIGMKTQGFYLVRNEREVDNPQWFSTANQKEDWKNYLRGEIRFDSKLDWFFGIGHNKNRAFPKDIVLDHLKQKVTPIIKTAVNEHKRVVSQRKEQEQENRKGRELAKKIHEDSNQFFIPDKKLEISEEGSKPRKKKTKEELKHNLLEKVENSPALTERMKKTRKEMIEDMFEGKLSGDTLISNDGATAPIFRTEVVDGKRIIMVNGDHKFYEHIYEPSMDNIYANTMIDLALYSLADVKDGLGDPRFVEIFEQIIARFSRKYGVMFNQKHFLEALSYLESEKDES